MWRDDDCSGTKACFDRGGIVSSGVIFCPTLKSLWRAFWHQASVFSELTSSAVQCKEAFLSHDSTVWLETHGHFGWSRDWDMHNITIHFAKVMYFYAWVMHITARQLSTSPFYVSTLAPSNRLTSEAFAGRRPRGLQSSYKSSGDPPIQLWLAVRRQYRINSDHSLKITTAMVTVRKSVPKSRNGCQTCKSVLLAIKFHFCDHISD